MIVYVVDIFIQKEKNGFGVNLYDELKTRNVMRHYMRRELLVTYIRIFVYLYVHSYTLFGCINLTIFNDVYKHS